MEDFIAAGIEGDILAKLNIFRLALCVTCRSNISTGGGKAILINALKGNKKWTLDQYIRPSQPIPHLRSWENWQSSLKYTYNISIALIL